MGGQAIFEVYNYGRGNQAYFSQAHEKYGRVSGIMSINSTYDDTIDKILNYVNEEAKKLLI